MEDAILAPVVQYGFAGLCAIQLVFIAWLVRRILEAFERNTKAFERMIVILNNRPCLMKDNLSNEA